MNLPGAIEVLDTHTEGEPTRVVIAGWPLEPGLPVAERRAQLLGSQRELARAVACEPRGHEAMVGALLTPPDGPGAESGVVFFNNVGPLWMCGHGLIGVVRALAHLGRVQPGRVGVDTPVGRVFALLEEGGSVTLENVPAECFRVGVEVEVPGVGRVVGDVAWGGNWFFLAEVPADSREVPAEPLRLAEVGRLRECATAIRQALAAAGVCGRNGEEIDHVELFGPPSGPEADSTNFVLCPGNAYDRSPCGTGTSAKMAALHARGQLAVGVRWRQQAITGGVFTGWLERRGESLLPFIQGRAWVMGRATLLFDPSDPFRSGFSEQG